MALSVKIAVLWRVTPRSLLAIRRCFGGTWCLHLKGGEYISLNCKFGRHAFEFIGNSDADNFHIPVDRLQEKNYCVWILN